MLPQSAAQQDKHSKMLARVKEFHENDDKLYAEYQHDIGIESGQLVSVIKKSRIMFQNRDENRDEYHNKCRDKNRFECGCGCGFECGYT